MAVTDGVGLVTQSVIQAAELSLSESVQVASDDIRVTPAGRAAGCPPLPRLVG